MKVNLHRIIVYNDYNLLMEYLNNKEAIYDVNKIDDQGMTPLTHCIKRKCCREIISEFINNKDVNPNITNEYGYSPLHFLCDNYYNIDISLIKSLVFRGDTNINLNTDILRYTPLNIAIDCNFVEAVEFLLSLDGIDTTKTYWDNKTIFQLTCFYGNVEMMQLLLMSDKVDPNIPFKHITDNLNREDVLNLIWDNRNKLVLEHEYYKHYEDKASQIFVLIILCMEDKYNI